MRTRAFLAELEDVVSNNPFREEIQLRNRLIVKPKQDVSPITDHDQVVPLHDSVVDMRQQMNVQSLVTDHNREIPSEFT